MEILNKLREISSVILDTEPHVIMIDVVFKDGQRMVRVSLSERPAFLDDYIGEEVETGENYNMHTVVIDGLVVMWFEEREDNDGSIEEDTGRA